MFDLKNKTALVTGGASGIGAAIATWFTAAGAKVWIADRDEANGKLMAGKISGNFFRQLNCGGNRHPYPAQQLPGEIQTGKHVVVQR